MLKRFISEFVGLLPGVHRVWRHRADAQTGALGHVGISPSFGLMGAPLSGASMKPARSPAPAVVSLELSSLWICCTRKFKPEESGA